MKNNNKITMLTNEYGWVAIIYGNALSLYDDEDNILAVYNRKNSEKMKRFTSHDHWRLVKGGVA